MEGILTSSSCRLKSFSVSSVVREAAWPGADGVGELRADVVIEACGAALVKPRAANAIMDLKTVMTAD